MQPIHAYRRPMKRFETIVLGLGAMGSAATYQLAKRGNRVLGIDRFSPPHNRGSTHGDTRITRLAIGEGEHYTPLALRSHEIWRDIEKITGARLLTCNGCLVISSRAKSSVTHVENFFDQTVAAARTFNIAHELLDATEIRRRFPQFRVADDEVGYLERDAGFVRPETCVRTQLALARQFGAEIHTGEKVLSFDASDGGVSVVSEHGCYVADQLIISAGAWLPSFVGEALAARFKVYRQVLFWFDIAVSGVSFLPEHLPVFIWELQQRRQGVYGFPALDGTRGGVKVATEQYDATTTPDTCDRNVTAGETRAMHEEYVAPYISGLSPRCLKAVACLYTVTPDFGFMIGKHPEWQRVIVASPCSGHGFKHSAAIGEALAELVMDGESHLDLSAFAIDRFD